ncbi:MAG: RHS repeat-associated core domain-containing protein [Bryobacteraceae bacterium]|nr:RHS repeat-associated core domain-containing protein [Bryobacteraceae bacterium]
MEDLVAGEEVTYAYDELGRLTRAETTGPQWGLSFSYDGFGNRLSQAQIKGTVPVVERTVNAANNRLVSQTGIPVAYDANGNLTLTHVAGCATAATLTYDQFNRLTQVTATGCYTEYYGYGADGRRVWKKTQVGSTVTETVYVYGVGGERIASYTPDTSGATLEFTNEKRWVYFGSRVVKGPDGPEFRDRLGSVALRGGTAASYFPYGEERTATAGEKDKFATYFRDGMTGLDYAQQRYYSSVVGRFLTADPYVAPGAAAEPQGWNRYGYVAGDPVNFNDPPGLVPCPAGSETTCIEVIAPYPVDLIGVVGVGPAGGGGGGGNIPSTFAMLNAETADRDETEKVTAGLRAMRATTAGLRPLLLNRITSLAGTNCGTIFSKDQEYDLSSGALTATARTATIWNINGSEGTLRLSQATGSLYDPDPMIRDYFSGEGGDAYYVSGNAIFVDSSFFVHPEFGPRTARSKATLLLHELLHMVTGLGDLEIARHFRIPLPANATEADASAAFRNWLNNDCND